MQLKELVRGPFRHAPAHVRDNGSGIVSAALWHSGTRAKTAIH